MRRSLFDKFTKEELIDLVLQQDAMIHYCKFCGGCKKYLPFSSFGKRKASKDGLQDRCRECTNASSRRWRAENIEYVRAKRKADYQLSKERFNDSK